MASCAADVDTVPQIRALDPQHCVATWDRVLLQIWRREVTQEAVLKLRAVGEQFSAEIREPLSMLSIIEPTSPPPSEKLRTSISEFYRELAPRMKEQIIVAEGSGFRVALVRSVGLALSAIAPRSLPFRFVGSVTEASRMIEPHLSPRSGGAEALQRAIHAARAQIP